MTHEAEIDSGERFEFGKNWSRFLAVLDDERIEEATKALRGGLGDIDLKGKTFLDVGSGSGLHSLAAMRLGAARVRSFDYDPHSVACTRELKRRFFADDERWTVEQASALDPELMKSLGTFDIVYSWGVLHHTGDMWKAFELVTQTVAPGGTLFIAIYRDEGWKSRAWLGLKQAYNKNAVTRAVIGGTYCGLNYAGGALADLVRFKNPVRRYAEYKKSRGMNKRVDWIDWIGGLPFEVATPDQILAFFKERGFRMDRLMTVVGHGCNEYVFTRR